MLLGHAVVSGDSPLLLRWSMYALFLTFFHLSEFFVTAMYNPRTVSCDSFLMNHSKAYQPVCNTNSNTNIKL